LSGLVVRHHVDGLEPVDVDGERGHRELVLARREAGDDAGEVRVLEVHLQAELLADRGAEVDVEADRLAVVHELVRRVALVLADHDLAVGLDRVRDERGELVVLRLDRHGGGGRGAGRGGGTAVGGAAGTVAARATSHRHARQRERRQQGERLKSGSTAHVVTPCNAS
jgi:hypothetical protein